MSETNEDGAENLREFTRVSAELRVTFEPADGSPPISGAAFDLSLGGLSMVARDTPVEGARGTLCIHLDATGEVEILATAHVVRSIAGGAAFEIEEYRDPASFAHMKNVVLYNSHETGRVQSELRDHIGLR